MKNYAGRGLAALALGTSSLLMVNGQTFGDNVQLNAIAHVTGSLQATFNFTYVHGQGVLMQVSDLHNFTNTTLGSYSYHIHTNPVNNTANTTSARCGAALAHLDPTNVTENIMCDPDLPAYCQIGDLSGKYGKINATENGLVEPFNKTARFLRFYPQDFSLLGRSIVIHGFNKTRLACGDIISALDGTLDPATGQATNKSSTYQTSYPAAAPPAPTTSVPLGTGTTINSAGLSSAGLSLPVSLPPVSEMPDIALITTDGHLAVASTTYPASGTSLPTQGAPGANNANAPLQTGDSGGAGSNTPAPLLSALLAGSAIYVVAARLV